MADPNTALLGCSGALREGCGQCENMLSGINHRCTVELMHQAAAALK